MGLFDLPSLSSGGWLRPRDPAGFCDTVAGLAGFAIYDAVVFEPVGLGDISTAFHGGGRVPNVLDCCRWKLDCRVHINTAIRSQRGRETSVTTGTRHCDSIATASNKLGSGAYRSPDVKRRGRSPIKPNDLGRQNTNSAWRSFDFISKVLSERAAMKSKA